MKKIRLRTSNEGKFDYVPCVEGCSECCGPILLSPKELAVIRGYMENHGRMAPNLIPGLNLPVDWEAGRSLNCAFLQEGRCSIYPARPLICRGMGAVDSEKLICYAHKVRAKNLMPKRNFNRLLRKAGYLI